jgi:hypothetical protein
VRIESITAADLTQNTDVLWDSDTGETVTVTACYPLLPDKGWKVPRDRADQLIWVELSNGSAGAVAPDQEFLRVC